MTRLKTNVIEQTLYKGKVKIKFFPDSHIYMVDGKRKTGVTTYLSMYDKSNALVIWATELARDFLLEKVKSGITDSDVYEACGLHQEKKEKAAAIGDEVHSWIEDYINKKNPEMPVSREAQIGVNAFLDWAKEHKVVFLSSERVLYSRKHDYVGKMDIEAKVNGKLCLIDIKTSGGLYNTYYAQTAAYVKADEEESGRKYHGRWLIRLAKESEKEYIARNDRKNSGRIARGKESIEVLPYQVFEAKFLDDEAENINRDFGAFLACKTLKEFDNLTGYWANKNK